jgi:hypothetical protein
VHTQIGLLAAMASNVAFALRAIYSKVAMTKAKDSTMLTAENFYGLVTIAAAAMCIPVALAFEGTSYVSKWNKALSNGKMELMLYEHDQTLMYTYITTYFTHSIHLLA